MCAVCDGPRPPSAPPTTIPVPILSPASHRPKAQECPSEEQQTRSAGIRRVRDEKMQERERILAEARADRQRFEDGGMGQSAPSSGSTTTTVTDPTQKAVPRAGSGPHTHTAIRVRLPDGVVAEQTFSATGILDQVFMHVDCF